MGNSGVRAHERVVSAVSAMGAQSCLRSLTLVGGLSGGSSAKGLGSALRWCSTQASTSFCLCSCVKLFNSALSSGVAASISFRKASSVATIYDGS